MNNLKVGNVIKISARKNAIYMITEVRESDYIIRRVNKHFEDMGHKATFRVPFTQMALIFEELVGTGTPIPKETQASPTSNGTELASVLVKNMQVYESQAVELLKRIASEYSPENLTCDGELTGADLRFKKRVLDRKWQALEMYFGYSIRNDLI